MVNDVQISHNKVSQLSRTEGRFDQNSKHILRRILIVKMGVYCKSVFTSYTMHEAWYHHTKHFSQFSKEVLQ